MEKVVSKVDLEGKVRYTSEEIRRIVLEVKGMPGNVEAKGRN